jgi:ribosomal subunit interface protein
MSLQLLLFVLILVISTLLNIDAFRRPLSYRQMKVSSQLVMKSASTSHVIDNVDITLRDGLEMTDALRTKIEKKITPSIKKFGENIVISAHVTLKLEPKNAKPQEQIVDVLCNMKGGGIVEAKSSNQDMYASIDIVSKTLTENLKKHKGKVKNVDHDKLGGSTTEDEADIINEV